jgi:putative ABC transport system substrate-binding protein
LHHIGILQLTQHLDDAVQGFKAGLAACGIAATYEYRNADGNVATLPTLAHSLEDLGVDLIFACSTPSAKAAAALSTDIPVLFTPVFDPVGAGLVATLDRPGGKVTGVAGMVPAAAKLDFISRLLPCTSTIGVLYHTADTNSVLEANNFKTAATDRYTITEMPFDQPQALSRLGELLKPPVDVLFLPIGKAIEENFATVVYYAELTAIPVIASNGGNVPAGALGALVADHGKLGYACAVQAAKILTGTAPGSFPVGKVDKPDILLNNYVANNLGIQIPSSLAADAKEIFE